MYCSKSVVASVYFLALYAASPSLNEIFVFDRGLTGGVNPSSSLSVAASGALCVATSLGCVAPGIAAFACAWSRFEQPPTASAAISATAAIVRFGLMYVLPWAGRFVKQPDIRPQGKRAAMAEGGKNVKFPGAAVFTRTRLQSAGV